MKSSAAEISTLGLHEQEVQLLRGALRLLLRIADTREHGVDLLLARSRPSRANSGRFAGPEKRLRRVHLGACRRDDGSEAASGRACRSRRRCPARGRR
jgi:hypothetical protein